ncbi:hypothetical protein, partial [Streptococcus uberis]|uniref:hypothetical protein n=1 Tax=Streptococcus uberis TaxID=1349 RepID=UPI0020BD934F
MRWSFTTASVRAVCGSVIVLWTMTAGALLFLRATSIDYLRRSFTTASVRAVCGSVIVLWTMTAGAL